jgi:hypothetical protein
VEAGVETNLLELNSGIMTLVTLAQSRFVAAGSNVNMVCGRLVQTLQARVGNVVKMDDRTECIVSS